MTLILCVRASISATPPPRRGLEVLTGKWDLHQNLGPLALGCETNAPAQHCRSLSHTLNPQAVRRNGHGLRVKATSVIANCYLQSRGQTGEPNPDGLGSRMPGNVGQGFLENTI